MNNEELNIYDIFLDDDYTGYYYLTESQIALFHWLNQQGYSMKIIPHGQKEPQKIE